MVPVRIANDGPCSITVLGMQDELSVVGQRDDETNAPERAVQSFGLHVGGVLDREPRPTNCRGCWGKVLGLPVSRARQSCVNTTVDER